MMEPTHIIGTKLDYWIVIAYFVLIFGFGAIFARFTRSTKDFFMGGQRFSWWLIAFSYVASIVGSYSFIKYSEAGFKFGMSSSMSYLNDWIILGFLLLGWFPLIYFSRSTSVPDYFSKRFDEKTKIMSTIFIMLYMIGYIGINLYTMGIALNAMIGTDVFWSAVVVAIVCAVYVTAGGQTSVIMTDLIQGFLLLAAGLFLLVLGLHYIGGWTVFWDALPMSFKLPFANLNKPHNFSFLGVFWQDGVANNIALYMMNQGFILRFLSLKSVKEGKKAFLALVLILMPLATIAIANAGWLGRAMVNLGILPMDIPAKTIFVAVADKICVPGLFGLVMAALTAALMSTIDTLINAVSAVTVNDIYKPYIMRAKSDKHYLVVARIVSLSSAGIGIALVPLFAGFTSIYVAHGSFTAAVTPPMVVAIVLGACWKRYTPNAAFWTLFGGALAILASVQWPILIKPVAHGVNMIGNFKYMRALYGLCASGIIAVVVTFITKPKPLEDINGYVIGTMNRAKEIYKGAPINEEEGKKVVGALNFIPGTDGILEVSRKFANELKANVGDLVYMSDARRWLGGLRSIHAKLSGIHDDVDNKINISKDLIDEGELIAGRKHRIEKIF